MIIQITAFIIAVIAYTISQLIMHEKFKLDGWLWDEDSWLNKYKMDRDFNGKLPAFANSNHWYYKFFKIGYKERFPGSATIFVSFTDGYHLMQMFFKAFLSIAIAGISWWAVAWFVGFGAIFTACYRLFSK
jgi:hypothetical protein